MVIKYLAFKLSFWLVLLASCSGDVPTLTTLAVTGITANSAVGGGNIIDEGSSGVVERGVCWSPDKTPTVSSDRTVNGAGTGEYSSNLIGLSPATQYRVRAYASNKAGISYGNELSFTTSSDGGGGGQGSGIIADHTVIDKYGDIPQYYIDEVKKMLVWCAGMSHSLGYQHGLNLLEQYDSRFQATTYLSDPPPAYTSQSLRLGRIFQSGDNTWTSDVSAYCGIMQNQSSGVQNPYSVFLYAWCWDMTWVNSPGGGLDPVYTVHWAGSAGGSRWGLDAGDQALTGNSISMETYFDAIELYNSQSVTNGYPTVTVFTTGPVDDNAGTENGYQRELKHNYIREYVNNHQDAILFDYADILVYNNSGQKNVVNWNDGGTLRPHAQIHPDNLRDYNSSWQMITPDGSGDPLGDDHIGEVGALRLAKAMWWMLARIAGWDGISK